MVPIRALPRYNFVENRRLKCALPLLSRPFLPSVAQDHTTEGGGGAQWRPSQPWVCPWRRQGACLSGRGHPHQPASSVDLHRARTYRVVYLAVALLSTPSQRDPAGIARHSLKHRTSNPKGSWTRPAGAVQFAQHITFVHIWFLPSSHEPWQLTGSAKGQK